MSNPTIELNWGPAIRYRKAILAIMMSAAALAVAYSVLSKHLQTACYSNSVISSELEAIEAAKELVVKNHIFSFPDVGTSRDFVASLDGYPKCCGARKYFSFTYLASVWRVVLISQEYFTFIEMDECGQKVLDRGRDTNG